MSKSIFACALLAGALSVPGAWAQAETADTVPAPHGDTALVQSAIYNRPYITTVGRTSVGGYAEAHGSYRVEEGITDGFSFDIPRFNLFVFSSIGPRLTFTSELEFEHGTEDIELETALLDFAVSPALVVRGGVFVVPIGAFNQNHDSPRYDFISRPLVSTEIIPATLSDVGFGVNGRVHLGGGTGQAGLGGVTLTYDAYLSNGLGGDVLFGEEERTRIANGKVEGRFGESPTGEPALSGRLAVHSERLGETGLSYFGGAYNPRHFAGEEIDDPRRLTIQALDYANTLGPVHLRGEIARASIDVPESLRELFGHRQWGGYLDLVTPVARPSGPGLRSSVVSLALRLEYVDYNVGRFASTGQAVGDEVVAVVPALSFRPVPNTIFRLNYRREWMRDRLRNPTERAGSVQAGFATYF